MAVIQPGSTFRVARPTDNLSAIAAMYESGLGFDVLARFADHDGFDGVVLGNREDNYQIEFTHHRGVSVGGAPSDDSVMVFYIEDQDAWRAACNRLESSGFVSVTSYNPYWDRCGKTFRDIDGYRVVLQNEKGGV